MRAKAWHKCLWAFCLNNGQAKEPSVILELKLWVKLKFYLKIVTRCVEILWLSPILSLRIRWLSWRCKDQGVSFDSEPRDKSFWLDLLRHMHPIGPHSVKCLPAPPVTLFHGTGDFASNASSIWFNSSVIMTFQSCYFIKVIHYILCSAM